MRFSISLFVVLAGGMFLSGCKTKSPPTSAELRQQALTNFTLPSAWKAGGPTNPIADNWLTTFDDAQLDALVREAVANNPDLRVSATRVEQAAGYVKVARASLYPALALVGKAGFKGSSSSDVSDTIQGIGLGASWEPDLWGRYRYAHKGAQAAYASTQADFEFGRQSIAATTARAWFTATETLLQKQFAEAMVRYSEQLVKLADKRWKVGSGNEQDVVLAQAGLSSYQDAAKQFGLAHEQAVRALELLLGRYPAAELKTRADLPSLREPVPAGLPLEMLERRPDVIAAERRVAAAFNRVGEAKAARLPRITLKAGGAYIESELFDLKKDFENPGFGGNGQFVAPLYTGGALKAQVEIRTAEQKQAVAEYARMALRAFNDVENALSVTHALQEREQILQTALKQQQRALELGETSYRVGQIDLRSVQQNQLNLHAARLALLRVQSEQLSQRVNLHLVLGGSFETPEAVALMDAK